MGRKLGVQEEGRQKVIDTKILKDPDLLTNEEVEQLLPILDELIDWRAR